MTPAEYRRLRRCVLERARIELASDQVEDFTEMLDLHGYDDTKACTRCKEEKPITEFSTDRGYRRGPCKACDAASKRKPGTPPRSERELAPCGTPAAARRHYRRGEPRDPACARALAEEQARRYRERRAREKASRETQIAA